MSKSHLDHFNMHKLFPEMFAEGDEMGIRLGTTAGSPITRARSGHLRFTSAKAVPIVTIFGYDTAWAPNNGTLQRLHELTGWTLRNEYEEGGLQIHGRFTCENGDCRNEELEYLTTCEICEEGKPEAEFDEEQDSLICNECRAKDKVLTSQSVIPRAGPQRVGSFFLCFPFLLHPQSQARRVDDKFTRAARTASSRPRCRDGLAHRAFTVGARGPKFKVTCRNHIER